MQKPSVIWRPSPNFGYNLVFQPAAGLPGRGGRSIAAIVDHVGNGFESSLNTRYLVPGGMSVHYLVTQDGRVVQFVRDEDAAYHVPGCNPSDRSLPWLPTLSMGKYAVTVVNQLTIGIDHEGFGVRPLTDAQFAASVALHRHLVAVHGIPADRDHIVGHVRLDRLLRGSCPGNRFPLERLVDAVAAAAPVAA